MDDGQLCDAAMELFDGAKIGVCFLSCKFFDENFTKKF